MEGVLYKWTNYLSGWQPRWFLLCGGILSYYDSREDAWKGCKGSIQMAVCEIQVHHADSTRMDLIIPGEQYFYLKARSAAERQKWLVALGTAKACLTDSRTQREKELTENTEALKTKMSELRLYCDLLVQQVDKTKEASICGVSESENGIDMGALLKSTCNTFLKTLEECMQIANVAFSSELLHRTPSGSPHLAVLKSNKVTPPVSSSSTTTERQMELNSCENGSVKAETNHCEQTLINTLIPSHLKSNEGDCDVSTEDHVEKKLTGDEVKDYEESKMLPIEGNSVNESLQLAMDSISGPAPSHWGEGKEEDLPTFFSVMNIRFSDIELQEGDGIPTEEFLQSCYAIVPVLDKLGPTVFAPVKMDFVGNIKGTSILTRRVGGVQSIFWVRFIASCLDAINRTRKCSPIDAGNPAPRTEQGESTGEPACRVWTTGKFELRDFDFSYVINVAEVAYLSSTRGFSVDQPLVSPHYSK
ncbi:pleckstrin homology domain-containing family A member 8 isoform 2-T2 [Macrochelys suwanniensis]